MLGYFLFFSRSRGLLCPGPLLLLLLNPLLARAVDNFVSAVSTSKRTSSSAPAAPSSSTSQSNVAPLVVQPSTYAEVIPKIRQRLVTGGEEEGEGEPQAGTELLFLPHTTLYVYDVEPFFEKLVARSTLMVDPKKNDVEQNKKKNIKQKQKNHDNSRKRRSQSERRTEEKLETVVAQYKALIANPSEVLPPDTEFPGRSICIFDKNYGLVAEFARKKRITNNPGTADLFFFPLWPEALCLLSKRIDSGNTKADELVLAGGEENENHLLSGQEITAQHRKLSSFFTLDLDPAQLPASSWFVCDLAKAALEFFREQLASIETRTRRDTAHDLLPKHVWYAERVVDFSAIAPPSGQEWLFSPEHPYAMTIPDIVQSGILLTMEDRTAHYHERLYRTRRSIIIPSFVNATAWWSESEAGPTGGSRSHLLFGKIAPSSLRNKMKKQYLLSFAGSMKLTGCHLAKERCGNLRSPEIRQKLRATIAKHEDVDGERTESALRVGEVDSGGGGHMDLLDTLDLAPTTEGQEDVGSSRSTQRSTTTSSSSSASAASLQELSQLPSKWLDLEHGYKHFGTSAIDAMKNLYQKSVFCAIVPGDARSTRRLFSVLVSSDCIPVLIDDELGLPFNSRFGRSSNTVRTAPDFVPHVAQHLEDKDDHEGRPPSENKIPMTASASSSPAATSWTSWDWDDEILIRIPEKRFLNEELNLQNQGSSQNRNASPFDLVQYLQTEILPDSTKMRKLQAGLQSVKKALCYQPDSHCERNLNRYAGESFHAAAAKVLLRDEFSGGAMSFIVRELMTTPVVQPVAQTRTTMTGSQNVVHSPVKTRTSGATTRTTTGDDRSFAEKQFNQGEDISSEAVEDYDSGLYYLTGGMYRYEE
ncbi:unnamed protein product [Amoebophrya sp. A120]|nr:unnamed protein product [Amoebophrya sp. A120]|eukprot:GSA120T00021137001.1